MARKCRRGLQSSDTSRVEKKERSIEKLSLRGAKRRGNPHPLTPCVKHTAIQKRNGFPRPVTSVTDLGMTEMVFTLPSLFPNGSLCTPETPQSLRDSSPKRGAKGCGVVNAPDSNLCRGALPLLGEVARSAEGAARAAAGAEHKRKNALNLHRRGRPLCRPA